MWSSARDIAAGDVVILWLTRDLVVPVTIVPGHVFTGRFGAYYHARLVGVPYGSKVAAHRGKGFLHVLRPTPELWTRALPHRTQILYLADIAFVTAWLAIRPGSRVLEAGTGSGSFTHSVARTIGPRGRLFSFDFHQPRVDKARAEFALHGMAPYVSLQHRNVCKDGFGLTDTADCVFLDLPAPWDAIPHAKTAMRKDRTARICCFSPCMEQVLRTVSTLNEHGFTEITMYETLLRPHEVAQHPAPLPIGPVRARLKAAEHRKEERRRLQIAAARAGDKRKRDDDDNDGDGDDGDDGAQGQGSPPKRLRTQADAPAAEGPARMDDEGPGPDAAGETSDPAPVPSPAPLPVKDGADGDASDPSSPPPPASLTVTQPIKEVRGHTSYLTFACLLPTAVPSPLPVPCDAVPEPEQDDEELGADPDPTTDHAADWATDLAADRVTDLAADNVTAGCP